jgi:hypothetical protein
MKTERKKKNLWWPFTSQKKNIQLEKKKKKREGNNGI